MLDVAESRKQKQQNCLPQGSVLATMLLNKNEHERVMNIRSFVCAADLRICYQDKTFEE